MAKSARCLALVSLLLVTSLISARRVTGQESQPAPNAEQPQPSVDSLPFRRGQWGVEFGMDDGTVGLGVLRFRSTRTAWQLNANVTASWSKSNAPYADQSSTNIFMNLRAGPRRYRPLAPDVAGFVGMGVSGGYGWSEGTTSWRRSWSAAVFGELGGAYFVTRRLSLGARVDASVGFTEFRQATPSFPAVVRDRFFNIGLSPVEIIGALYF